jgi:hypothetical protein
MKVVEGKPMSQESYFSIVAYTALELVSQVGTVGQDDLKAMLGKEFPGDEGARAVKDVFDALVDSRLVAYRPSKGTYRMSQAGKLTYAIAHCVVHAVGAGMAVDDVHEKNEQLQ